MASALPSPFTLFFSFFKKSLTAHQKEEISYEDNIKKIGDFSSVEEFWTLWQHIVMPEQLPIGCEIFMFRQGIKPMWEDPCNEGGGRFVVRLQKQVGNRLWEDIVLSLIGELSFVTTKITGLICTVKEKEVVVSIWTKSLDNDEKAMLKKWILSSMELEQTIPLDYREHPKPTN